MSDKIAIIAGATGLTGRILLELLLKEDRYTKVVALTRKPLNIDQTKLQQVIVDFDALATLRNNLIGDDIYCCLGTTMKKAGSKSAFAKVDYEYPLHLAKITKELGASQFLLISAIGANENSSIFYNKIKGKVEQAIAKLQFDSYHVFRPSLILGHRDERRSGERFTQLTLRLLGFLFVGSLKKYKGIQADKIAKALIETAKKDQTGQYIHESDVLQNY